MSIQIDKENTIGFERPLTRVVKENIRITNPHAKPVAFKVKTTAPKLYCVRPNSDIIPPNSYADVQIMLQAYREEPPLDVKCKDKFLILSTLVEGPLESMSLADLWTHVEGSDKGRINEKKLRCAFIQPSDHIHNEAHVPSGNAAAPVAAAVPVAAAKTTNTTSPSASEEKLKQMEEELKKYKKEVEVLRDNEPVVVEKVQVKTTGYPISIFILFALLAAAVAYFLQTNNQQ